MRIRSIAFALAFALGTAAAAAAQDPALDRVQNLINTGRLTDARSTLQQWERAHGGPTSDATAADRARSLYLSGVLSTEPEAAEQAFVNVVLSHPSSAVAPDALLRLGQARFSAGDNERAIEYLLRLQSDYPRSTARETGVLWLARAQLARGAAAEACGTARDNLAATTNANLRMLIEIERDRACAASGGEATRIASQGVSPSSAAPDPVRTPSNTSASPDRPTTIRPRSEANSPLASLPDLGVAVDANVREPEPAGAPAQRPAGAQPAPAAHVDTVRETAPSEPQQRAAAAAVANVGEYGVQIAAFSQLASAQRIADEVKAKGFDARVVTVPGSGLYRVRYGAFTTSRDAAAAALHIRDAGFATLIVNDVRLEQRQ